MSQKRPQAGERFLHFKNKLYQVLTIAQHSETGEELVVYQALYGDYRVYARPLAMFVGEVDRQKYPQVKQRYRFELVGGVRNEEPPEHKEPEGRLEQRPVKEPEGAPEQSASKEPEGSSEQRPVKEPERRPERRLLKEPEGSAPAGQPQSGRRSQFARQPRLLVQPRSAAERKTVAEGATAKREPTTMEELLTAFFDAHSYGIRYQILEQMEGGLTDLMIDNMAVVMDVVIPEGPLEKRYEELKRCVRTYEKYELPRGY